MPSFVSRAIVLIRFVYDVAVASFILLSGRFLPLPQIEATDLTGKNVIVTGANSGIGLSIAKSLARQHATVYLACRSITRAEDAVREIAGSNEFMTERIHVVKLDTSSLASVRAFADAWSKDSIGKDRKIDVLVHNAGISGPPPGQSVTDEGFGMIYATNFLGSFLLTSLLETSLANDARVMFTSSTGQYGGNPWDVLSNPGLVPQNSRTGDSGFYASTKSMQVIFAKLLQRRWNMQAVETKRIAHSFTPGYTYTPIFDKMRALPAVFDPVFWFLKTATLLSTPVDVGAATGTWLASTNDAEVRDPSNGGMYWERCTRRLTTADAIQAVYGAGVLEKLWPVWCRDSGAQWD